VIQDENAGTPMTGPEFQGFPLGVTDPAATTAFVAEPAGNVVALDLESGKVRWRQDEVGFPLLTTADQLITWQPDSTGGYSARVLLLDTQNAGKLVTASQPIDLPNGADPLPAPYGNLRIEAEQVGNALLVQWTITLRYRGGAPPPPHILEAASGEIHKAFRIDPAIGAVTPVPTPPASEGSYPASAPYNQKGTWRTEAWIFDGRTAWLESRQVDGQTTLVLHTQLLTGQQDEIVVELAAGKEIPPPTVTLDGRFVLVGDAHSTPDSGPFRMYDCATGSVVATITLDQGAQMIRVIGRRIYYADFGHGVIRVVAHDLDNGRILWQHSIAATAEARSLRP
jgi:hypothetical protein